MKVSDESAIERQFARLPTAMQLSVLERLVHQMRENLGLRQGEWESGLTAMAADPEIQSQLSVTHSEFGLAEADGLGRI